MRKNIFTIIIILLVSASCLNSSSNKRKNTVDSSAPQAPTPYYPLPPAGTPVNPVPSTGGTGEYGQDGPGTGYGDGNEPGVPNPSNTSAPEYYSINGIIVHGTANPNRYAPPNGILWSSTEGVSSNDQHIFTTNSRFNVRVRAQAGPAQNTLDTRSIACQYNNSIYNKLLVTLCVRKQNGSCIYTQTFDDVPVGQVSKVKEFNIPLSTAEPLVIDVLDVQWDYTCISYGEQGFSNQTGYCPWAPVWDTQCVKFDVQFSTDDTTDLPGPRY